MVEQAWLPGLDTLDLRVVEMDGWERSMRWVDTGLEWIATSPALDTPESALLYPATIWFEATSMSYGRGTEDPFRVVAAPWLDAEAAMAELSERGLPGVTFSAGEIRPELLPGITVEPAFLGEQLPAIHLEVTNPATIEPTELGLHLLDVVLAQALANDIELLARPAWLDQLSGNTRLRTEIESGDLDIEAILADRPSALSSIVGPLEDAYLYE